MFRKAILAPVVLAIVAVMAVPAGASWGRGGGSQPGTIVDVLIAKSSTDGFDHNSRDYDILITAATTADLVGALSDPSAQLTVFAPDDAAFIRTAQTLGFTGSDEAGAWNFLVGAFTQLGNGDPIPVLTTVLLYHVAPERLNAIRVVFSRQVDTLANASFGVRLFTLIDNAPKLPNPTLNFFALNQRASNGIIHGVTRVLIPLDIG